tara:strand:- start:1375 stop:2445 length:1071 start_codon:yes stop_codon:yes gene_type:complete
MASSYTNNLGIEKPGSGEQAGTWGTTTNLNFDIIDRAVSGVGAVTLSNTTHTLTTEDGILSEGGHRVLVLGGSPSGTNTITISPNDQDKVYLVKNGSGQTATFSQGSGANASVVNGEIAWIFADGAGAGAAVEKAEFTPDIVNDLTPQLGGNLDVNAKNITFGDSSGASDDRLTFGAGTDLSIYHDGTDSNIVNATNELNIKGDGITLLSNTSGEEYITCDLNGAVTLYHNDVIKAATTANGLSITGTAVATTNTDTSNSGNVTLDFSANQNFVLTLTGDVTLDNPTTEQVGQSGFIVFIQDSTGGREVSLGTQYKTKGGVNTLNLSSAAAAIDLVPYVVIAADSILLGTPQKNFS